MKHWVSLFLLLMLLPNTTAQNTNNKRVSNNRIIESAFRNSSQQAVITEEIPEPEYVHESLTPTIPFTPLVVSMYGYTKRYNEAKENFILRNETHNYHISRVKLKLLYKADSGEVLHEREELIECDLPPGASQMVSIKSFDSSRNYYYYKTPSKKGGVSFRIQYDLLRYDIVVE